MPNLSQPNSAGDKAARFAGFLFLLLIPYTVLTSHTAEPAWLTQDFILRWASTAIFFLCLGLYFLKPAEKPVLTLDFPDLALLLLSGWVLLSVKNSSEAFESFYAFRGFLATALLWFSLRALWKRWPELFPRFEKVFFWTAVLAGIWLFISTAGRWVWFDTFKRFIPREGLFPNQNIAAGFLGMALLWGTLKALHRAEASSRGPASVGPGDFKKSPVHNSTVSKAGLLLLLVAWGLTESRGSLISIVVVAVVYLVTHMQEVEDRLSRWAFPQWAAFGGAVLLVAACSSLMVNRLFRAMELDPRADFRIDLWASVLKMVKAQPLLGFGPGTFGDVFPAYRPSSFWNVNTPFAHSEYLQTATDCGLPALALALVFLWLLLRETGTSALKSPFLKPVSPSSGAAECAFYLILFEAVHNAVDFTFHEWSHRLVLLGFATYALRDRTVGGDLKAVFYLSRRIFLGGALVLSLFLAWVLGAGVFRDYLARLHVFQGGSFFQQGGDLDRSEASVRKSLGLRVDNWEAWNLLGGIENARAAAAPNPAEGEKHFRLADEYFQRAIQSSPYALAPRENQIQNLIKRGRLSQAMDLENQLIEKGPAIPDSYWNLGKILMRMGRAKEAIAPAQKLIDQFPYYLPGYFLKADALEALGRRREALRVYEDARDMLQNLHMPDPSGQVEPGIQRLKGAS